MACRRNRQRLGMPGHNARHVIRDSCNVVVLQPCQQANVARGEAGPAAVDRIINLAAQILIVLSGDAGHGVSGITLPRCPVTRFTESKVDARAARHELTAADAGWRWIVELADVTRHVSDSLGIREAMPVGEVLHQDVPTLTVTEGHKLSHDHTEILAANARHLAVDLPAALRAVASRAGREIARAVLEIRRHLHRAEELLIRGGHGECEN